MRIVMQLISWENLLILLYDSVGTLLPIILRFKATIVGRCVHGPNKAQMALLDDNRNRVKVLYI